MNESNHKNKDTTNINCVNKKLTPLEIIQLNALFKSLGKNKLIPLKNNFEQKLYECGLTYSKFQKLLNIFVEIKHAELLHRKGEVFFRLTDAGRDWLIEDDSKKDIGRKSLFEDNLQCLDGLWEDFKL